MEWFSWIQDPQAWVALATLAALEIVLGIDNIIFISILVGRLPPERQQAARISGLALAMVTRIALLFSIVWLTRLTQPWFFLGDQGVSGRDLVLFHEYFHGDDGSGVGAVVSGIMFFNFTQDNLRHFAVLKAIGATPRQLLGMVFEPVAPGGVLQEEPRQPRPRHPVPPEEGRGEGEGPPA